MKTRVRSGEHLRAALCVSSHHTLLGIEVELHLRTLQLGARNSTQSARPYGGLGTSPSSRSMRLLCVHRFVTQDELSSLSSYMRGRLTLDKVTSSPACCSQLTACLQAAGSKIFAARSSLVTLLPVERCAVLS